MRKGMKKAIKRRSYHYAFYYQSGTLVGRFVIPTRHKITPYHLKDFDKIASGIARIDQTSIITNYKYF